MPDNFCSRIRTCVGKVLSRGSTIDPNVETHGISVRYITWWNVSDKNLMGFDHCKIRRVFRNTALSQNDLFCAILVPGSAEETLYFNMHSLSGIGKKKKTRTQYPFVNPFNPFRICQAKKRFCRILIIFSIIYM